MLPILSSTLVVAEDGLPYLFTYPDEVIYISVEPCEYNNALFTIEVVVANVTDCKGVQFWLNYNSTLLSKEGSIDFAGPFDSGNPPLSPWGGGSDHSIPGTLKVIVSWSMAAPPFNGTATVCAITFKIIYCPPQNNTVSCDLAFDELRTNIWDSAGFPQPRDPSVNGYYEYTTIYPSSVGGIWVPVDKLGLLAPYVALVATIILAISVSAAIIKHKKKP